MARIYEARTAGQTLQPTALVNEPYLRPADLGHVHLRDRAHFFALPARLRRRILVDLARAKGIRNQAATCGGSRSINAWSVYEPDADLVAVDGALAAFATVDPRRAHVVELRLFGGLQR